MSKYFLGIDAGSSSTKWAVVDEHKTEIIRGKSAPVDGHLYNEESRKRISTFLTELHSEIKYPISAIYAGVTGASDLPEENYAIENVIKEYFADSKAKVVMDVALGYRSNVRDEVGIYIYAGTGSIAVYKDSKGSYRTVGGWGYLLGDEGAGYWIGIAALRAILFEIEKGEHNSRLIEIFRSEKDKVTFLRIKELVYGSARSEVAALAKEVLALANSGDEKAIEIAKQAAAELSTLVKRTQALVGSDRGQIIFGGGIAGASGALIQEMERILAKTIQISSEDLSLDAAHFAVEDFSSTS